jgi:hypothetical protein
MKINLKVRSFKRLDNPKAIDDFERKNLRFKNVFYVNVLDIKKELGDQMRTNPRSQKFTQSVAKKISETLISQDNFHELNRGVVFSVNSINYDNQTKIASLEFIDEDVHGNIDGGHTLKIIIQLNEFLEFYDNKTIETLNDENIFKQTYIKNESDIDVSE